MISNVLKHGALLFIFLFPLILFGQIRPQIVKNQDNGMFECIQVQNVDSLNADELYNRALEWVAVNYKSANDVIQYQNAEQHKIIIKGALPVSLFMKKGWINHTLTLEFKDSRYRYSYTSMSYYSPGSGEIPFESSMVSKKKVFSTAEDGFEDSIRRLNKHLNGQIKDNTW